MSYTKQKSPAREHWLIKEQRALLRVHELAEAFPQTGAYDYPTISSRIDNLLRAEGLPVPLYRGLDIAMLYEAASNSDIRLEARMMVGAEKANLNVGLRQIERLLKRDAIFWVLMDSSPICLSEFDAPRMLGHMYPDKSSVLLVSDQTFVALDTWAVSWEGALPTSMRYFWPLAVIHSDESPLDPFGGRPQLIPSKVALWSYGVARVKVSESGPLFRAIANKEFTVSAVVATGTDSADIIFQIGARDSTDWKLKTDGVRDQAKNGGYGLPEFDLQTIVPLPGVHPEADLVYLNFNP